MCITSRKKENMGKVKDSFINQYGAAEWEKVKQYGLGNRSPENTNAMRIYSQHQKGQHSDTFTIYGVLENGKIIYVGNTGLNLRVRWNAHKTKARTLKHSRPLHNHMNTVSSNHDLFPEFDICALETATDQKTADIIEKALINKYNTHVNGFNKKIGGGMKGRFKSTRPQTNSDIETR